MCLLMAVWKQQERSMSAHVQKKNSKRVVVAHGHVKFFLSASKKEIVSAPGHRETARKNSVCSLLYRYNNEELCLVMGL